MNEYAVISIIGIMKIALKKKKKKRDDDDTGIISAPLWHNAILISIIVLIVSGPAVH